MNTKVRSKKDIIQALGYTLLLIALSFPLSLLGMQLLNAILGGIPI